MPVISALGRLRQEDHEFEVSLGYIVKLSQKHKKRMRRTHLTAGKS
jgi:hypothetical protein